MPRDSSGYIVGALLSKVSRSGSSVQEGLMVHDEFNFWYSRVGRYSFVTLFAAIFTFGFSLTQYGGWILQMLAGYWLLMNLILHCYARHWFLRYDGSNRHRRIFFEEEGPNFASCFFLWVFLVIWGFTVFIGLVDPHLIPSPFLVLGWEIMAWVSVQIGILLIAIAARI